MTDTQSEVFDLSDFDTDEEAVDHRVFLAAIADAAAEGGQRGVEAALVRFQQVLGAAVSRIEMTSPPDVLVPTLPENTGPSLSNLTAMGQSLVLAAVFGVGAISGAVAVLFLR